MNRFLIIGIVSFLASGLALADQPDRAQLTAVELAREIDRHILERLDVADMKPAPLCSDAEFLRRAYLDIAGIVPAADKAAAFLESTVPNKRQRLIDELLADRRYGQRMADVWLKLLVQKEGNNTRIISFDPLRDWLAQRFNRNQPWGELVAEVLTASGTQSENAATTFYLTGPAPERITDKVSQLFLGIRLECAQCHDHPFSTWKQADYWGLAAFFSGLRYEGFRITNPSAVHEFGAGKPYPQPESYLNAAPRFLHGNEVETNGQQPLRPLLARWLTARDNTYFTRALVNRMWAQYFGRGLVHPVDDMTEENAPSHPELLDLLAEQFAANNFDLKYLVRAICSSHSYQRSAAGGTEESVYLFGHMAVRVLAPEQLYDSLVAVIGTQGRIGRPGGGPQVSQRQRENFVEFFKAEEEDDALTYQAGIPQALRLMNGDALISLRIPLIREVVALPAEQGVERLFLTTLSRPPSDSERERCSSLVRQAGNREQGYCALLWALVNCSEFVLNH